jgi:hypothetical protein
MGGSAARSGSPGPCPPPVLLGPRVGAGRRPLSMASVAATVVVCGVLGWWSAAAGAARLVSARCG